MHTINAIKEMLLQINDTSPPIHQDPRSLSVVIDAFLYKEKTRAEIALNSISDAVICTDMQGNIDYLNIAAEKITGWDRNLAYGRPLQQVFNIVDGATGLPCCNPVSMVLQSSLATSAVADEFLVKRDGSETAIEHSSSPIFNADEQLTGVVIVFHDVSEAKAMAFEMAHLAQHDYLTNLPNRVLLNDRIAQAIESAKRYDTQLAILFLDLDNFKHINDSLGHGVGDALLKEVTASLNACVRASDTVSRLGGDEFIILLAERKRGEDGARTAEKILELFSMPHRVGEHKLHVTTSIGVSIYPTDGENAETLIKNADTAMYHAKEKGRNNFQFFKADMNKRAVERQNLEANLRVALDKSQFFLLYQPKFNLANSQITGVEALLRWQHDQWGEIMPERFVPVAEDSGLIIPIGRWVLREVCQQIKRWSAAGLPHMTVAVNISAQEFMQKNFVADLQAILIETQVDPHDLALEISETALMRDAKASAIILHQLKAMGLSLVMDDFGTGYSSLSYLEQFPIDALKIDKSFVNDITSVADDGIVVTAIIGMGNSLRLKVIAEGIETSGQLAFLVNRHCKEGQGYLFSHPLTSQQLADLYLTKQFNIVRKLN